jgi:hypothetical protein
LLYKTTTVGVGKEEKVGHKQQERIQIPIYEPPFYFAIALL